MNDLIGELSTIFTDPEFHIGMDEVDTKCMENSKEVTEAGKQSKKTLLDIFDRYLERHMTLFDTI